MKKEKIIDTAAEVETVATEAAAEAPSEKTDKLAAKKSATKTVSVELTDEQYSFLTGWQKTHEAELGIEVPIGALVRKTVEIAMKAKNTKPESSERRSIEGGGERKSFGDRGSKPSFGGRDGGRPSFGKRSSFGGTSRGPKFGGFNKKNITRNFDK